MFEALHVVIVCYSYSYSYSVCLGLENKFTVNVILSKKISAAICPKIHIWRSVQRSKRRRSFVCGQVGDGHVSRGQVGGYYDTRINHEHNSPGGQTHLLSCRLCKQIICKFIATGTTFA